MNERILPSPPLQTLFVSRETSNCPLIAEMIALGHLVKTLNIGDHDTVHVSFDYGKRLVINAKNSDVKSMSQQDAVEIVDYDPLKNVMMVIGQKDPCIQSPVHWIVQKARQDINCLVHIQSKTLAETLKGKFPETEHEPHNDSIQQAKELLVALRDGKTIIVKNQGVLYAGINRKEVEQTLRTHLEGLL